MHRATAALPFASLALIALLAGCARSPEPERYCYLDAAQKPLAIASVRAAAESISGDENRYLVPELLLDEGLLYRDSRGCWSYLILSSSDSDRGELQGIAGVYLDPETMQADEIFWFRY